MGLSYNQHRLKPLGKEGERERRGEGEGGGQRERGEGGERRELTETGLKLDPECHFQLNGN